MFFIRIELKESDMAVALYQHLIVWQKAMDLTVEVYHLVRQLPKHEMYGLISQMTRAAASIPANIAEGNARSSRKEYAHFLAIASGSLTELETYLILCTRLNYITLDQIDKSQSLITEIAKMLNTLRYRLSSPSNP
jgi:four helix bundle protein